MAARLKRLRKKSTKAAKSSPQALKRNAFSTTDGTTEVVPFPTTCVNRSFSAAFEAVPYPKPTFETRSAKTWENPRFISL
jgi:hypothetical protein